MFASRIVCGCSFSSQPSAAGVVNVLCSSSCVENPAGTGVLSRRLTVYDAVVLPSFVTTQLVSLKPAFCRFGF